MSSLLTVVFALKSSFLFPSLLPVATPASVLSQCRWWRNPYSHLLSSWESSAVEPVVRPMSPGVSPCWMLL